MIKFYQISYQIITLIHKVLQLFTRFVNFFKALLIGLSLGSLKRNSLSKIDQLFYNKQKLYITDNYNKKQLFCWEKLVIQQYFKECKTILVMAAGGGREVYNLSKMGYEVEGSEYNNNLREYANIFLAREGINSKILPAERDKCPEFKKKFDGIIMGWGAYTHIKGSSNRIDFLKGISELLNPGGVVLISFWAIRYTYMNLGRIEKIANFVANICKNEKIEKGDFLDPEYVHYFSKMEIEAELNSANFDQLFFEDEVYGHAIGKIKDN